MNVDGSTMADRDACLCEFLEGRLGDTDATKVVGKDGRSACVLGVP